VSVPKKSMKRLIIWEMAQEEEEEEEACRGLASLCFQIPTYIIGLDSLCGSGGLFYCFSPSIVMVKSITRIPNLVLRMLLMPTSYLTWCNNRRTMCKLNGGTKAG
jgi:hypothetical protein